LFIFNGRTPGDELKEFTCLANGGCNTIDYARYCAMGGDSDHMLLCLRLSIDCDFVEPQHMVVTKKFLPKFKYDKSKVEEYISLP
jgi:hypothetical protein